MRKLEIFKTGILCVLILSSVIMSARLWFFDEIFYINSDFSSLSPNLEEQENHFGITTNEQSAVMQKIFSPVLAVYSYEGTRLYQGGTKSEVASMTEEVKKEIIRILSDPGTTVSYDIGQVDFNRAMEQGIFCDYDFNLSLNVFLNAIGVKLPDGTDDMIFCYSGIYLDEENKTALLMFKNKYGQIRGFLGSYLESFAQEVKDLAKSGEQKVLFPFEEALWQKIELPYFIEDESLFFIDPKEEDILYRENVLTDGEQSAEYKTAVERILNAFLYNEASIKKYTSSEGKMVYVENYSTLSIDEAGIEYGCTIGQKGIPLFKNTGGDAVILTRFDLVLQSMYLLTNLGSDLTGGDADIQFGGMEYQKESGGYRLYFKYVYQGTDIQFDNADASNGYPIVIDVNQGYITNAVIHTGAFYPTGSVKKRTSVNILAVILNQEGKKESARYGIRYAQGDDGLYRPYDGLY